FSVSLSLPIFAVREKGCELGRKKDGGGAGERRLGFYRSLIITWKYFTIW
ncbi:hypothetical protein LINPERHAP2_LOCUS43136, partial [Linum perenne]